MLNLSLGPGHFVGLVAAPFIAAFRNLKPEVTVTATACSSWGSAFTHALLSLGFEMHLW